MIKSIKHRGLKKFATKGDASGLNPKWIKRIKRILVALDQADKVEDLNDLNLRLHQHKGDAAGTFSLDVTRNFRITFKYDGGFTDVDLKDPH